MGVNHLLVRFLGEWHGETRSLSESAMRLFAKEVAPRFASIAPPADLRALEAAPAV
jgi:hypothetical protein